MDRLDIPDRVCIDGSLGEGGGQILRTSLALNIHIVVEGTEGQEGRVQIRPNKAADR